jgi:hypothetical protein
MGIVRTGGGLAHEDDDSKFAAERAASAERAFERAFDWCGNWQYVVERVCCVSWIAVMVVVYLFWTRLI